MKRLAIIIALVMLPLLSPRAASAQAGDAIKKNADALLTVELRFGPYRPRVDEGVSGGRPYDKAFGDTTRFMVGGEIDWQFFHVKHAGSLGLGGLFGYTRANANARFSDGSGDSAETTTFSMWLLSALLVARLDVLARETWIPLVPYAKIGPSAAFWTASNGSGTVTAGGVEGRGRTFGMTYTIGGMFMLDAIDRQSAKTFAAEQGVKHTYFFFEYMMAELSGLGQSGAMRVGDRTWQLGLAMEL